MTEINNIICDKIQLGIQQERVYGFWVPYDVSVNVCIQIMTITRQFPQKTLEI